MYIGIYWYILVYIDIYWYKNIYLIKNKKMIDNKFDFNIDLKFIKLMKVKSPER